MKTRIVFLITLLMLLGSMGYPCTTFIIKNSEAQIAFGRNFDFPVGSGHIHINYRNINKTSFIRPPEVPYTWVSKFGSVTFNQAGKEFPYGGINEKGLVIEQMWLQEAEYPEYDERFGMNELQWIQYQLDMSATVDDVIASDSAIRISKMATSFLHFLITDSLGNTAVIEYVKGKRVVYKNEDLPYKVLSNCTYQNSLNYKVSIANKSNAEFNEWTKYSSGRFIKAADMIDDYDNKQDLIGYSFTILDNVSQANSTKWSIVYDISNLKIYYKTDIESNLRIINLETIDFSCNDISLFVPINENVSSQDSFRNLTYDDNYALMEHVVSNVDFLKNTVPKEYLKMSANYFETIKCKEN